MLQFLQVAVGRRAVERGQGQDSEVDGDVGELQQEVVEVVSRVVEQPLVWRRGEHGQRSSLHTHARPHTDTHTYINMHTHTQPRHRTHTHTANCELKVLQTKLWEAVANKTEKT